MNDREFDQFLNYLTSDEAGGMDDGVLIGPLEVPGGPFVPPDMPLYVGKIKTGIRIK
jgi:hypothetical protein